MAKRSSTSKELDENDLLENFVKPLSRKATSISLNQKHLLSQTYLPSIHSETRTMGCGWRNWRGGRNCPTIN
jgi:hypothetical protein